MNSITASINSMIMGRAAPAIAANMSAALSEVYTPQIPEGLAFDNGAGEMISLESMVAAQMLTDPSSQLVNAMNNLTAPASLASALLDSVGSSVDISV